MCGTSCTPPPIVITKEALCFYKFEHDLSHDDSITENDHMNINDISGSYVSNI